VVVCGRGGRATIRLHGALVAEVVVAFAFAWSPPVGPMVAATGRLLPLGSLVAVAGQVAQATNGAVGVAAGLPLFKRGVLAVRPAPRP
jgi:hypothetical protein